MTTTMAAVRAWRGPAILSYGFRPFFFLGAAHAALMVALWVPWHLGFLSMPSAFPPVAWHAHELLFGYVLAIVAGFLLTAVPNWTGRMPVVGWPLAALVLLWLLGRLVVAASDLLAPSIVVIASLAFPVALLAILGREIAAARNWRNLKILATIAVLTIAQGVFHWEVERFGRATYGDHLAIAAAIVLIIIVGGRIIPSFTTNWLKRANPGPLPTPHDGFDDAASLVGACALALWVAAPALSGLEYVLASILFVAGVLNVIRLARWRAWRSFAEPLVLVLHVAYAFVPIGFFFAVAAILYGSDVGATAATHAWAIGAIGLMTLAVMTRATRGHTGRALTAPPATVAIYLFMLIAVAARITATLVPETTMITLPLAGTGWVTAMLLFCIAYGPAIWRPRLG
jgi:uncharacterized protein involved in response to NO